MTEERQPDEVLLGKAREWMKHQTCRNKRISELLAAFAQSIQAELWEPEREQENALISELIDKCQQTPIHKQDADFFRGIIRKHPSSIQAEADEQLAEAHQEIADLYSVINRANEVAEQQLAEASGHCAHCVCECPECRK